MENSKDWLQLEDQKYQILSFQHPENGNIYKLNSDGTYGFQTSEGYKIWFNSVDPKYRPKDLHIPFEECLKRYPIHSVKRLSDNLDVTVGRNGVNQIFKISSSILILSEQCSDLLEKYKEPVKKLTITIKEGTKLINTVTLNKGERLLINY